MDSQALFAAVWLTAQVFGPIGIKAVIRQLAVCANVITAVLALAGCASLPENVQRSVSTTRTDVSDTRLAAIAAASAPEGGHGLSGLRLLPEGDQAFDARIALTRRAEKSLDLQYYQLAVDQSGLTLLRELRDAAARGVRVRLLLDDLYAAGECGLLQGLAAHPNVELRLFNPLPARKGGLGTRIVMSLHELSRINRRMHNKLFIADASFALAGGRNIGDDYFGRNATAHFIDFDVLISGPAVAELGNVFDRFWNSEHAYPVQSLAGAGTSSALARGRFDERVADLHRKVAAAGAVSTTGVEEQLERGRIEQHFAPVRVLADAPAKIDDDRPERGDGAVMSATLALLRSAETEVMLASPYFIPGRPTLKTLQDAAARNVKIEVLTNSLMTTDEALVHIGYARYRMALLRMGVGLYELMPRPSTGAQAASGAHGSLGRLHAKLAVVDRRWLFIGSMNMDQRSARLNTEVGLVIDSPELAAEVSDLLRRVHLPTSYELRLNHTSQQIEWQSGSADARRVLHAEPGARTQPHFERRVISILVKEEML